MKKKMQIALPERLRPLFWSYVFESIDPARNKRLVVKQILNYGTLQDWRWMVSLYGRDEIRNIISSLTESELKPQTCLLAEVIFNAKPQYTLRHLH